MNNIFSRLLSFRKSTAPADPEKKAAVSVSYSEQAVSGLISLLSRIPDVDDVLRKAGKQRKDLRVLLTDDEISQAVETRIDAILAAPRRIEPSEGNHAKLANKYFMPFVEAIITCAIQARFFGYSVGEIVYVKIPELTYAIAFVGEKPMEWFEPKSDGRLIYRKDNAGTLEGVEVDQQYKFLLTRNRPTYMQPYGEALLSRLYWPWFFRTNGWKFWAKFLERFGSPLLLGKSSDPEAMATALLQAHSQAVIAVDTDDHVETVGASSGNGGGASFDTFETANIRRIQKVILGQTLTSGTDGGAGNRALGKVHDNVRSDKVRSDIKLVVVTVQRALDAFCALNGLKPMVFVLGEIRGIQDDRAARDKDLFAVGVRFKKAYFVDNYELDENHFDVVDPATQTNPPGVKPSNRPKDPPADPTADPPADPKKTD